jgi:DUF4097 and DUF4098 domain-containing protein YvlB
VVAGFLASAAAALAQTQPGPRIVVSNAMRTAHPYQGRANGAEQTERFSRKVKIGRDGRVSLANIAGDIVVTAGSGDEVSIEAVKRTRGNRADLANVQIVVDERGGRVDIRTDGEANRADRNRRSVNVAVDFTLIVPVSASLELHSVSGSIKVSGVRGAVREESVSGDVTATDTPKLEAAKTISGNVLISGVSVDGELTVGSVSGNVTARGVKVHGLDLGSVSGNVSVTDATCDRLGVKSVNGTIEYAGTITKAGRYDLNTHSGSVRLSLTNPPGFELNATTFSGAIRSDFPMTIGGAADARDRGRRTLMNNRSMRATFGDGSATLTIRTFSGDIVISKK